MADTYNNAIRLLTPVASLSLTTPTTLPAGTVGTPYSQTLSATGGFAPYTWSLISGALPGGLSLSANGSISGTPFAWGTFSFTIQVADIASNSATQAFNLTIAPSSLTITTTSLPTAYVNVPYSQTLTATAGSPPYTWSLASGALPAGLSLSAAGAITGTPTTGGISFFTVGVTDTASTTLGTPSVWTNASSISTISRANGVNVTWSGGAPNSYLVISGSSSASASFQTLTVAFACVAPVSAGQFTVPPAILQSLPAGSAGSPTPPTLGVANWANPVLFSASGLDLGYVTSYVSDSINVTYQ